MSDLEKIINECDKELSECKGNSDFICTFKDTNHIGELRIGDKVMKCYLAECKGTRIASFADGTAKTIHTFTIIEY